MRISLTEAQSLLSQGEVIAIPTDTVYGLAADMHNSDAVDRIFVIKKRPQDKPLIILFSNLSQITTWISEKPPGFDLLATHFWPGALTLIVPINPLLIPPIIRSHLPTAGFRMPQHPLLLELISAFGPIVAPSANFSGKLSATTAAHVEQDFGASFPVLDGGACLKGVESTLLIYQEEMWKIARQGAVLPSELEKVLGYPLKMASENVTPSQYSPKARLKLGYGPYEGIIKTVIGFANRQYPSAERIISLGSLTDPNGIAQRLYTVLREVDQQGIEDIWVDMNFPREGILATIAERLEKAAQKS